MQVLSNVPLRPKTTMRVGGTAEYFAELRAMPDVEEAVLFASKKKCQMIPLGSGSNTIFCDGTLKALVIQVKFDAVTVEGTKVTVGAGKNLAMLVNELAALGLDLSVLTGIPGTIGGAIFGNAGQGPKGIWIDSFVESVTVYDGEWKTLPRSECGFGYRESGFKSHKSQVISDVSMSPIIWEAELVVPKRDSDAIKANIQSLLQKRIETQPHARTAGSCFKAVGDTPAWQLIDAAGLRGYKVGDIEISTKHANFLLSGKEPKFTDVMTLIRTVKEKIPEGLEVEMQCYDEDGSLTI